MSYYPPAAPPPPPGPRPTADKSGRTALIIVAIVLAVVMLCCVSAAGGYWLYGTIDRAISPPRDATTAHLDLLRTGDYDTAYQQLCEEQRQAVSSAEYAAQASAGPQIVGYDVASTNVSTVNGQASATVVVDLTYDTGANQQEIIRLVEEDGEWRVCR